ncbi:MAG: hypothetical protein V7K47_20280 [Nostoc sp.]
MWFDSLPYGTLLLAYFPYGVRLRSGQVAHQPGDEGAVAVSLSPLATTACSLPIS